MRQLGALVHWACLSCDLYLFLGLQLANGNNEEQLVREAPAAAEPNGAAAAPTEAAAAAGRPGPAGHIAGGDEKDNPGQLPSAKKKKKGAAGELEMERHVASVSGIMSQQVRLSREVRKGGWSGYL